jgi:hypothetical protein
MSKGRNACGLWLVASGGGQGGGNYGPKAGLFAGNSGGTKRVGIGTGGHGSLWGDWAYNLERFPG